MTTRTFAALIPLASILFACSVDEATGPEAADVPRSRWASLGWPCPSDAPAPSLPQSARESLPPPGTDLNAEWAAIARRTPGGWGGYFIDNGKPTVYLLEPSKLEDAAEALRAEGIPVPPSVAVKQGRWDFAQLYDWYRYLNRHLWPVEGVSFSDIQEARNRLEYGAIDEPTRAKMEDILADLDVPCFLVAIEIQEYAVILASAP